MGRRNWACYEVDTANWKIRETTVFGVSQGMDWVPASHGRVFVAHTDGGFGGLVRRAERAEAPQEHPTHFLGGHYLAATPDGRFVFCSGARATGLWVVRADQPPGDPDPTWLPVAASLRGDRSVGPIVLSPDGRWVLFRSGDVVRVDDSTPGPGAAGVGK
ncbi:MAG TPA: hypothetical protein VKE74_15770 [Gemmataceae bacterium]|nr:hypothetical protein [Gemmataceae bacterium]